MIKSTTLKNLDPASFRQENDDTEIKLTVSQLKGLLANSSGKNSGNQGFKPSNRSFVYKVNKLVVSTIQKPDGSTYEALVLGETEGNGLRRVIPLHSNKFGTPWNVKEDEGGTRYIDGFGCFERSDRPNHFGKRSKLLKPAKPPKGVRVASLSVLVLPAETNIDSIPGVIASAKMSNGDHHILKWVKD